MQQRRGAGQQGEWTASAPPAAAPHPAAPPQNNHHVANISAKMAALGEKVSELERAAAQRKAKLDENSAFLQFNWKADVVESWIGTLPPPDRGFSDRRGAWPSLEPGNPSSTLTPPSSFPGEKENSLKTDDYGRDLSSVQTLLTKQVGSSRPLSSSSSSCSCSSRSWPSAAGDL